MSETCEPAGARVLHVLRDAALDGPSNMARDDQLLHAERFRPAALRLYRWRPATISLGTFQRFDDVALLAEEVRSLPVVRRITGGGAILHDDEQTYCLVLDDSQEPARRSPVALYLLVHEAWRAALASAGVAATLAPDDWPMPTPRNGPFFCFEKPGRTDLLLGGAKLLGSAQRRVAGRVLQHGSLILGRRFASHPGAALGIADSRRIDAIIDAFVREVAARLGLAPVETQWSPVDADGIAAHRERHAGDAWLRLR